MHPIIKIVRRTLLCDLSFHLSTDGVVIALVRCPAGFLALSSEPLISISVRVPVCFLHSWQQYRESSRHGTAVGRDLKGRACKARRRASELPALNSGGHWVACFQIPSDANETFCGGERYQSFVEIKRMGNQIYRVKLIVNSSQIQSPEFASRVIIKRADSWLGSLSILNFHRPFCYAHAHSFSLRISEASKVELPMPCGFNSVKAQQFNNSEGTLRVLCNDESRWL